MRRAYDFPTSFAIRGGRVIDPANAIDRIADVIVAEGRIASVGGNPSTGLATIDARGLIVCPGLIDIHVHLREPGGEHKETIETGTRAAAAGGFSSVACMPNTTPAIDNASLVEFVHARAKTTGWCRVYPIAAITVGRQGSELVDMSGLREHGVLAFSDDGDGVDDERVMRDAMERARPIDALLIQHCEDKSLAAGGVMHKGTVSQRLGLSGIDSAAEVTMVQRDLALVRETGARYHVAHISTAGAVELVRAAKVEGLPVTAEVCTHHLLLTDEACERQDPSTKMKPPLRSESDMQACVEGVRDGTIDCIVTDHAPHTAQEKGIGFREAPFGVVGLETALPVAVKALVTSGTMGWSDLIRRLSVVPASILGLEGGTLSCGAPADITVIDPAATWRIDPSLFTSRSRNTPFDGWEVTGRPAATFVDGCVTYRDSTVEGHFALP